MGRSEITEPPSFDGERLLHVCADPYGSDAFVFPFSDGTALIVNARGSHSRWSEEPWEVGALARGARCPWTWVPGQVRAEVWRRAMEKDQFAGAVYPASGL